MEEGQALGKVITYPEVADSMLMKIHTKLTIWERWEGIYGERSVYADRFEGEVLGIELF